MLTSKRLWLIIVSLLLITLLAIGKWVYHQWHQPLQVEQAKPILFSIAKGTSFNRVVSMLEERNLLPNRLLFSFLAWSRGARGRIQAGEFEIQPHWNLEKLLNHLVSGQTRLVRITFPEGLTYQEVIQKLVAADLGNREHFLALFTNEALIDLAGIRGLTTLEGVLYPETYFFSKSHTEEEILTLMIQEFRRVYETEFLDAKLPDLSIHEVLVLASIIEKETGKEEDRPLISGVFHNRLQRKIKLQSDPTVIYGLKNFDGNLTKKHLQTPTPHNTYTNRNLPPTPICNPGLASLQSAVYPKQVDYLYFVAKGDGSSIFSKTLKEHNRAVWKYQRSRR